MVQQLFALLLSSWCGVAFSYEPIANPRQSATQALQQSIKSLASVAMAAGGGSRIANAAADQQLYIGSSTVGSSVAPVLTPQSPYAGLPLGENAYSTLGTMPVCKLMNGMWQVSGAHGYAPVQDDAVNIMAKAAERGFTSFDAADIYGPAEDYIGAFQDVKISKDCQLFTKWVPRPGMTSVPAGVVKDAINKSLRRMRTDRLDLLQFHWWEYENLAYYEALHHLMQLQEDQKIRNLALTNIDSLHMLDMVRQGAPIVSNQVSFSVLDTRPLSLMVGFMVLYCIVLEFFCAISCCLLDLSGIDRHRSTPCYFLRSEYGLSPAAGCDRSVNAVRVARALCE
jgi:diketogulonate reductase-like aldo/keto reductase